ncbi:hypothetical protein GHA57_14215, partial [Enterococcus faecium]|nr:hypothetical protein [Enterococcus faecium]
IVIPPAIFFYYSTLFDSRFKTLQQNRNLKYRLRKLLKEESQNDELTNHLRETFKESANDLKIELDTWLLGLDVTEK